MTTTALSATALEPTTAPPTTAPPTTAPPATDGATLTPAPHVATASPPLPAPPRSAPPRGPGARLRSRWRSAVRGCADAGLATAEYAVVLIAAVGFAGLLVVILSSDEVRQTLLGLVQQALSVG